MLDFSRCAMLPLRDAPTGEPGDEVGGAADLDAEPLRGGGRRARTSPPSARRVPGPHFDDVAGRLGRRDRGRRRGRLARPSSRA